MDYEGYRDYHAVNLDAQTSTASPVQLMVLLMDGLLEEMARARAHIEQRRYEAKGRCVSKCIDILNGLSSSLDLDAQAVRWQKTSRACTSTVPAV
ncbi:flagellar export chaperone FliS [Paludibacterium denitrificans]|uniref:flagellar export chaperone FliS n=1 Tax=Paludibacterium denitrificans TaxID=2675226 RepID=UPI0024781414|nr:flagellar export chaperone FliS [Paludibacterium denitrificans]